MNTVTLKARAEDDGAAHRDETRWRWANELVGGDRVSKGEPRVEAYGSIDELNSVMGFARSICDDAEVCELAKAIQRELFALGTPGGSPARAPGGHSEPPPRLEISGFQWTGEISPQKWMNFYTKVLSRFATAGGLKLTVTVDVDAPGGTTMSKVEGTKVTLREVGMPEDVSIKSGARS